MTNLLHRKDKFVTIHKECLEIQPSTSMHIAARAQQLRVELIFTFLYAGSSIQNVTEQFISCIHLSFVNLVLHSTPLTKSNIARSEDSNSSSSVTLQN
jgi:hypothetical protein